MEGEIAVIITRFRNESSRISQRIFDDFATSVSGLNRQTDENVFQQQQARYLQELENQLHQFASKTVEENRGHNAVALLQHELPIQVSYILAEFLVKAKSM